MTGLDAGSQYWSRVILKNYYEDDRSSGWNNNPFYTPNTVEVPVVQSKNDPDLATNASATLYAPYNVGYSPAHPTNSKIEYRESGTSGWSTVTGSISQINTRVNFSLSNLKAKTSYEVRVSVLNASDVWSNAATQTFTTNPMVLKLSLIHI